MPGNGTKQTMWMRFRASYFDRATENWYRRRGDSRSPWIKRRRRALRARARRAAGSRSTRPLPTTTYVVRGVVEYQWRRKTGEVVRRAKQVTLSGHPTGRHARPARLLGRLCEIKFP